MGNPRLSKHKHIVQVEIGNTIWLHMLWNSYVIVYHTDPEKHTEAFASLAYSDNDLLFSRSEFSRVKVKGHLTNNYSYTEFQFLVS